MGYRICGSFEFLAIVHNFTIVEALYQILILHYFLEIQRLLLQAYGLL